MTPLCGLMFNCGCTWPWQGLDSHCNIHDSTALHQCPWCVSLLAGALSLGLAVLLGFLLAINVTSSGYDSRYAMAWNATGRVMLGLLSFVAISLISGYFVGAWQGYPYFVLMDAW